MKSRKSELYYHLLIFRNYQCGILNIRIWVTGTRPLIYSSFVCFCYFGQVKLVKNKQKSVIGGALFTVSVRWRHQSIWQRALTVFVADIVRAGRKSIFYYAKISKVSIDSTVLPCVQRKFNHLPKHMFITFSWYLGIISANFSISCLAYV